MSKNGLLIYSQKECIGEYDFVAKQLYQVKDAQLFLMDIAKEYQENEKLIASLDSMYGSGSAKYMIQMSVTDGKERRAFEGE